MARGPKVARGGVESGPRSPFKKVINLESLRKCHLDFGFGKLDRKNGTLRAGNC